MVQIDIDMPTRCFDCLIEQANDCTMSYECPLVYKGYTGKTRMTGRLAECPLRDVQPVRHGHWILDKAFVNIETYYYRCSECGNERCFTEDYKADWCEECGARMDGEQNG